MGVIYSATLRTARMNEVLTAIGAAGKLEIGTTGMASILATIPLANPAGTVTGDVLTLTVPVSDTNAANSGTAAVARIRTGADADVVTGLTVGTGSENIVIDSTTVTAGQTLTLNSGTITHNTSGS